MRQEEIKNIAQVQRDRLCTLCGTCFAVCPKDNLEPCRTWSGVLKYRVRDEARCVGCGLCARVCPGAYLDLRELNEAVFGEVPTDAITGVVRKVLLTRAADEQVHLAGASGGTMTALTRWLLEKGLVDGVLASRMGTADDPLAPQAFIARRIEELDGTGGSIYQKAAANEALRGELKDGVRLACVGLGCQIRGLRKAALHLKPWRENIALAIGLFCGHNADRPGTEHLLRRAGVKPGDAAQVRFRKGRHPGAFWVRTRSGEEREIPFRRFTYFLTLFENHRCGLCTDPLNAMADLSVGDAWLTEKTIGDGRERAGGWNVTIVRSERGEEFIQRAIADGALLAEPAELDSIKQTQALVLYRRNRGGEARARLRRLAGTKLPDEPGMVRETPRRNDYVAALKTLLLNWMARGRLRRRLVELCLPLLLWMDERSMRRKDRLAGRDEKWIEQFEEE